MTRGQDKVFLKLIPHAKEKVKFELEEKISLVLIFFQVVEAVGHFLQESNGEELAKNVLDFLKSQN